MRDLPLAPRWYLWTACLACLALVSGQVGLFMARGPAWHDLQAALGEAALFVLLAYAGERATLQAGGSIMRSLTVALQLAAVLVLPPPMPTLVILIAVLLAQAAHAHALLPVRSFAVSRSTLTAGLASTALAHVAAPATLLRPGHILAAIPTLALLLVLFRLVDGALLLGGRVLHSRLSWQTWTWAHMDGRTALLHGRTVLTESAISALGIVAALVWRYDRFALALVVLAMVGLGVAFRAIVAENRTRALQRRGDQLHTMLAAGQHLRLQQSQADLMQLVADAARAVVGAAAVTAYLPDEEDPTLLKRIALAPSDAGVAGPPSIHVPLPGRGFHYVATTGGERALLVPLELEGVGVAGLLWLAGVPVAGDYGDYHAVDILVTEIGDRDVLAILATQAAIALQNARLHERALAQVSQDSLTGLLNHRAFHTRLEEEVARAQRYGHPLTVMMVDLDDFGVINNSYGHQAGDATLAAVAAALPGSLRSTDVAARYGGDEFAVILPETEIDEATTIAERMQSAIAALRIIDSGVCIRVGASAGLAAYPQHARSRDALVRAADHALYAAKHAGKGRTTRPEDAAFPLDRDPDALAARLEHANMATVEALAAAVDAKDPYTRGHSQRVSAYAAALASALGLAPAEVAQVRLAGLLHDVGKIGVPDAILSKPGKLTAQEFALIAQHPVIGETLLGAVPFLRAILPAVRHHHERWDGNGYPDGLAHETIPRDAAILAVADAFDAMTSSRTYRPALPVEEARRRVREGSGTQFDPRLVRAFEQALADGTLTLIRSGGATARATDYLGRAGAALGADTAARQPADALHRQTA